MSNTVKGFQTLQGIVQYDYESLKNKPDIDRKIQEAFEDAALPNPHKLTFTGAVQAEYDGSEAVEVKIPQGGNGGGIEVTGASVGQTIVVKAVDDNGKPTEWETRDFPDSSQNVELDTTLTLKDGVLSVNTVNQIIRDEPRPVTSGAVYEEFSKAIALLNTI